MNDVFAFFAFVLFHWRNEIKKNIREMKRDVDEEKRKKFEIDADPRLFMGLDFAKL